MDQQTVLLEAGQASVPAHWTARSWGGIKGIVWLRIAILTGLLVALFWPNLRRLWLKTNPIDGEANWGHAFFVPIIGIYYLYQNREALLSDSLRRPPAFFVQAFGAWLQAQLVGWGVVFFVWAYYPLILERPFSRWLIEGTLALFGLITFAWTYLTVVRSPRSAPASRRFFAALADSSSSWFGFYALLWGLVFYAWSIWPGQNDFFKDCSMIFTLFGVVLLLCGWSAMKLAWFPIFFLGCAFPWPPLIYSKIAMPLQKLSAEAAVVTLQLTGVQAAREGNEIIIGVLGNARTLNVAEACAGIKSLMTFITLAAALAFLSARPLWQRLLMSLFAIPIAILCNMIRVAGQGLLDHYVSHSLSESFAHQFVGVIMLIPALFMILFVGWVLDHLFVEEETPENRVAPIAAAAVIEIPSRRALRDSAPRPASPATTPAPANADLAAATLRLTSAQDSRRPRADAGPASDANAPRTEETP